MIGSMLFRLLFIVKLLLSVSAAIADEAGMSNYKLGSGDTISINVYDEKELSIEKTRLSDAGTVSLPMLGEIKVLGLTVSELELQVVQGLKQYLVTPKVTVSIEVYRDFFVNGQVYKPGSFPYQPGLTVLKAVAIAGGFKDRASKTHVAIIKDGDDKHTPIKADLGLLVMPGDIITVEESFF
jgi:polysaccharide biosynthesis/export protein VpsN